MKTLFIIIVILCVFPECFAGGNSHVKLVSPTEKIEYDTVPYMVDDKYFQAACTELTKMFKGEEPYSLKRAEFLVEWAYSGGQLDYDVFCHDIDSVVGLLNDFIDMRNIRKYRTAPNYALFDYFTVPSERNDFLPFTYDFEDNMGVKDYNKLFVGKVMRTHTGQCTSMAMFYKIICDELGGESFFAFAPSHMYIKHIDEQGNWVNVELTHGGFVRDVWMIETMDISTEAIRNGIFLCSLSERENLGLMMMFLAKAYQAKYHSWDYFVKNAIDVVIADLPGFTDVLQMKACYFQEHKILFPETYGVKTSPYYNTIMMEYDDIVNRLNHLGYRQIQWDEYYKRVRDAQDALRRKGVIE